MVVHKHCNSVCGGSVNLLWPQCVPDMHVVNRCKCKAKHPYTHKIIKHTYAIHTQHTRTILYVSHGLSLSIHDWMLLLGPEKLYCSLGKKAHLALRSMLPHLFIPFSSVFLTALLVTERSPTSPRQEGMPLTDSAGSAMGSYRPSVGVYYRPPSLCWWRKVSW